MEKENSETQSEKIVLLSKNPPLSESVPQLYTRLPIWLSLILTFRSKFILTIEPVLFMFMFGVYFRSSVLTQYIFNRYGQEAFKTELNYSGPFNFCMTVETLDVLVSNGTGNYVSQQTSYLNMGIGITSQLPGIFAALIFGPLSDRIGRRFMMIIIPCASCASAVLIILLITLNWQVELLALIVTLNGVVGGVPGIVTVVYSYCSDVSSKRWRTFRIGVLESMIYLSASLGLLTGGEWLRKTDCDFTDLFYLYFAANAAIIVYVLLWLPESVSSNRRKEKFQGQSPLGLFRVAGRGFRLFVNRGNSSRWKLWITAIAMFFGYFIVIGATQVNILFLVNYPLLWLPDLIGYFQAMSEIAHGLCLLVILPILVVLRVPDALIMLVSFLWAGLSFVSIVFVRETWHMFLVGVIQGVEVLGGPPIRSILSKAVSPEEQGELIFDPEFFTLELWRLNNACALFSVVAAVQVIASVLSSVMFLFMFPWILTLRWPAGYIYFFLAGFCFIVLPIPIILLIFKKGEVPELPPSTEKDDGIANNGSQEVDSESEWETSVLHSSPPPTSYASYSNENSVTFKDRQ